MNIRNIVRDCWLILFLCMLVLLSGRYGLRAEEPSPALPATTAPDTTLLTEEKSKQKQEEIQQKLASLEASGLSEEDRKKATDYYQKALNALTNLEEYRKQLARHESESRSYEVDLEDFQGKLGKMTNGEVAPLDPQTDLATLQQQLATQDQVVQSAQTDFDRSEQQLKNRQTRLAEIPRQTVEKQQELEKLVAQLEQANGRETTDALVDAEREALRARVEALKMQLAEMAAQRQYFTTSPDLAQVRRDYRAKFLAQEAKKLAALRQAIDARRLAQAKEQATEADAARTAAVERPTVIAGLADHNSAVADEQTKVAEKSAELTDELAEVREDRKKLTDAFSRSEEMVEAAGSTDVGQELRRQQELLPDISTISRQIAIGEQELVNAGYRYLELNERRAEIVDSDLEQRVAEILSDIPLDQRIGAEDEIRKLLEDERKIVESTIETYDTYTNTLTELLAAQEGLRIEAGDYGDFIAEHVLWIRSTNLPRLADFEAGKGAVGWTIDPDNWRDVLTALWDKGGDWPLVILLFAVLMLFSLYMHRRLRIRLRAIGEKAAKRTSTDFWPSVEALWITVLLALPWPLLLSFVGWWMDSPLNESEFVRSLSVSLQFTACCLFLLELVRHLCRSAGLADAHFSWPQSCLLQVRRHVRWLIWLCLPLVLWLTSLEVQNVEKLWSSSLGRACFVVVMLSLSFAAYRVLLSSSSPYRQLLTKKADSVAMRLFHVWSPVVTVLPLLLALVAIIGYYYTAQQLAVRLLETAGLVLVLSIIGGLAKRWILVNRRRLAREQAKQKRAQALANAAATGVGDETAPIPPAELVEDSVDLVALGEQTAKLLSTILVAAGLVSAWFVWRDMLPALSYFGQRPVFPQENPDNIADALRWGQLIKFFLALVVTYIAVVNLPALMEFALLQRLPLDSGSRYAITSISRYVIVAIGLTAAYTSMGFDGTSIQWLVAAMGVGLGFGLQEIFANFVSGIILLFERPIRVGDIVTLGDKTGVVSRIRMRSTTIVDPDRKEYIVPNKDLITERLLNWTLTDAINRVEIKVGVAYGSDTDLVCRLLHEVADEHPLILKEPECIVTFDAFGASTLDFTMRCFLPNLEKRLLTIHDLNTAVNQKFAAAGVEIAFPQTDIHVRSLPKEWLQQQGHATSNGKGDGAAQSAAGRGQGEN